MLTQTLGLNIWTGIKGPLVVLLAACLLPTDAVAACSDKRIERLSQQGNTVSAIAKLCEMSTSEVREVLAQLEEEDEEEPQESPEPKKTTTKGLPPGTPLAPCGCWGFASPGDRQPQPQCQSGFAYPQMCPQPCPAGGFAWRGICG